jgi:4'-phosphopantetheinyl transferase
MITLTTVFTDTEEAKSLVARWATTDDHAQAKSRHNKIIQQNFLLTRATLRALLAHVTGADDWHIRPDAQGKPQSLTAAGARGAHISLSHTHGLIACAASEEGPIGIDVEYWRLRDFSSLADFAFGPGERQEVARYGVSAFYRIWTLREAIAKATGNGLMAAIDGQDQVAAAPLSGCWVSGEWRLFNASPHINYSLAVASKSENTWPETSLTWIDTITLN